MVVGLVEAMPGILVTVTVVIPVVAMRELEVTVVAATELLLASRRGSVLFPCGCL